MILRIIFDDGYTMDYDGNDLLNAIETLKAQHGNVMVSYLVDVQK